MEQRGRGFTDPHVLIDGIAFGGRHRSSVARQQRLVQVERGCCGRQSFLSVLVFIRGIYWFSENV